MTLEQLKRHMDRRFDRLQRTKADKSDLKRFATKAEVRRIRQDLARYATKADLERFATKEDLRALTIDVNRRFDSVNDKIDSLVRMLRKRFDDQDAHLNRIYVEHGERLKDLEQRVGI